LEIEKTKMIKSLSIKNFQSHENLDIEFSEGVTGLIGRSQSGKTAALRALSLLTENKPSSARFYSNFAPKNGSTEISLDIDNNKISVIKNVKVAKDKTKNLTSTNYIINGEEFSGVGRNVPDRIVEALNISELNIQKQLDQPFLITSSPGEVSRTINKITNIDKADVWISELNKKINSSKREILETEADIDNIKKNLKKYDGIDKVENKIKVLKLKDKKITNFTEGYNNILELTSEITELEIETGNLKEIYNDIKKQVDFVISKVEEINSQLNGLYLHEDIINDYIELKQDTDVLKDLLTSENSLNELYEVNKELENLYLKEDLLIDYVNMVIEVDVLKELMISEKNLNELQNIGMELNDLETKKIIINEFLELNQETEIKKDKYNEYKKEYIDLLKKLGKCPICFSELKNNNLRVILEGL